MATTKPPSDVSEPSDEDPFLAQTRAKRVVHSRNTENGQAASPVEEAPEPTRNDTARSRKGVAGATAIMMAGILGSRVLGLVRESVIAHQFGQDKVTDVYNAAFIIPDLLFFLIAGGAFSGAFIPVFSEYINTNREREAWKIFSGVATIMMVIVTAIIVFCEIFTVPLVVLTNSGYVEHLLKPGLSGIHAFTNLFQVAIGIYMHHLPMPDKVADTVRLTKILLPAQICFFLGGLMMGTLQVRGNFIGQALGPVIYNLGIIMGGVLLIHAMPPGREVDALCWGAVIGAVVGNLGLQWVLVVRSGGYFARSDLRSHFRHPGVRQVWKLMLPVILGLALPQVSTIIGRSFASTLGNGAQSALMNANKLMQVPLGVFAQATAMAIYPVMTAQAARMKEAQGQNNHAVARRERDALRNSINYGVRSILFLTIPSSMLMCVLALPFVQLVFQSGKFSIEDAMLAANVLRWFAVGIFAWSAHAVITRGFYALQDSKTPVIVGTIVTLIFIPLNFPLMSWLKVSGLALATSIAATIHMLAMLYLLRNRLRGLDGGRMLRSLTRILTASVLSSLVCWLLYRPLSHRFLEHATKGARGHAALVLLVCIAVSAVVYAGMAIALHMEEVAVLRPVLRRLRLAR